MIPSSPQLLHIVHNTLYVTLPKVAIENTILTLRHLVVRLCSPFLPAKLAIGVQTIILLRFRLQCLRRQPFAPSFRSCPVVAFAVPVITLSDRISRFTFTTLESIFSGLIDQPLPRDCFMLRQLKRSIRINVLLLICIPILFTSSTKSVIAVISTKE